MGPLAGLTAREVMRKLRRAGFVFDRQAKGSHEIWWNPRTRARTTVPNHPGDLPEGTVRAIVKQAGLSVEEFQRLSGVESAVRAPAPSVGLHNRQVYGEILGLPASEMEALEAEKVFY